MLGPKGLLEGASGPWTPQWFAEEHSRLFMQVVQVTAGGTRRQVDLGNCQLAAAAMVPLAGRNAMVEYVKQVQSDLLRYRRQFVVGSTHRVRCSVAPMAVEERTGAMVFSPPAGRGFTANWVPRSADRTSSINVKAASGMDVVIPLVVVPLRPAKSFSISVPLLRSPTGRVLAFEKPGLVAYCVQRVPRVVSAQASFLPWVLVAPPKFRAEAGDVCLILLKGRIRTPMPAGKYAGRLAVTRSGLRTDVPLEIDLLDFSVGSADDPVIGAASSVVADDLYGPLSASLPPAQKVLETGKVRRLLLTSGIDALLIPGVSVSSSGGTTSISSSKCAANLKGFPADVTTRGRTILVASRMAADFTTGTAKMLSLASAARLKRRYLLWWTSGSVATTDKAAGTALGTAEKGSAMMGIDGSALLAVEDVSVLSPWSALVVVPDAKALGKGVTGALRGGVKKVYLYSGHPDRYVSGFYSCAVGAAGSYVRGASAANGGAYSGCWINGRGMLAVQGDGSLAPTVALVKMWQARSDYQLMQSCRTLLAKHKNAPGAAELAAVLKKITDTVAAHDAPTFDFVFLRSTAVSPVTMEAWRAELFAAAAKMLGR